jgi:CMP-N-acetylneuraminic acid synthetase
MMAPTFCGSTLAVVPARSGSKRAPGKNLAIVGGKPLIAHAIDAARAARSVDRVVVTTDCEKIADAARRYGAECPFLRPADLASDDAPGRAVWKHAVAWLAEHEGYRPARTVLLQPTSPLRTASDVEAAIDLHERREADWVVSVVAVQDPSPWSTPLGPEDRLAGYASIPLEWTRGQSPLEPLYRPNGAVFAARTDVLMESVALYTDRTYAYVMPIDRSLDVDTPWDLYLADLVLKDRIHGRLA